ncbi:hypothetical protein [Fortiea contorta]|uniref:hypothetical protein n=1 Tax=Fortiea contorta TaxID=1892405 RepID=UPI00034AA94A|nr:hypothetical protein [Fortiea contorta]
MNIAKLILLACPVFLASVLLLGNPAQASSIKSVDTTQLVPDLVAPNLATASNPIMDQVGCSCATCVQAKFEMLQGKLPSVGF